MTISHSETQTIELAQQLAEKVRDGGIILLYGDLGSGKTHFTKGLAEAFKIEKFSIKSPTYTYVRQYPLDDQNLYHIDLYRLEGEDPLLAEEIMEFAENPKNIIIIEWADRLHFPLPGSVISVKFEYLDSHSRKITIDED